MRHIITFLVSLVFIGCGKSIFKTRWTKEIAPVSFNARFETSKGNIDVDINRSWSPKAADRFFQLVKHHVLDHALFYRVIPGFVAQFGSSDTTIMNYWDSTKVQDEPLIKSNLRGTLSFARSGAETRSTQLYFNLVDNSFLDTLSFQKVIGFPVIGMVSNGMPVVDSIYAGYSSKPMDTLKTMFEHRSKFVKIFPKLDSIKKAYILKSK
jgi:peptidyl-prolyl cis-trans isomerase A (cyclophilin A)